MSIGPASKLSRTFFEGTPLTSQKNVEKYFLIKSSQIQPLRDSCNFIIKEFQIYLLVMSFWKTNICIIYGFINKKYTQISEVSNVTQFSEKRFEKITLNDILHSTNIRQCLMYSKYSFVQHISYLAGQKFSQRRLNLPKLPAKCFPFGNSHKTISHRVGAVHLASRRVSSTPNNS